MLKKIITTCVFALFAYTTSTTCSEITIDRKYNNEIIYAITNEAKKTKGFFNVIDHQLKKIGTLISIEAPDNKAYEESFQEIINTLFFMKVAYILTSVISTSHSAYNTSEELLEFYKKHTNVFVVNTHYSHPVTYAYFYPDESLIQYKNVQDKPHEIDLYMGKYCIGKGIFILEKTTVHLYISPTYIDDKPFINSIHNKLRRLFSDKNYLSQKFIQKGSTNLFRE